MRRSTGEDKIDHAPADETVRFYTGNAFDVVGHRVRTYFRTDSSQRWADESFQITLRNHKTTPVDVRVVGHVHRWTNWKIARKSDDFSNRTPKPSGSACLCRRTVRRS